MSKIPQKVHYIWFGNNEKNELVKKCIAKTKQLLFDWDIQEWNEDNYDITSCEYMYEAYKVGKYAFASDYARFDILYKYGGIYIDTDVELLKKFPANLMGKAGFTGVESNGKVAPGLMFACVPHHPIVKEILQQYEMDHFVYKDGSFNTKTVVDRVTEVFQKYGFLINGEEQELDSFVIYPSDYFCAYDFVTKQFTVTNNTISIHHYTATWINRRSRIKMATQDILRNMLGIDRYKKLIKIKRKLFGVNGE